ncbi:MAG TPA: GNAT family N-acetyltransferase [Egibacteraceae bacterium]|nr:GNAT family N-acetyltransferase [Egibacteraceae bacterium]
MRPDDVAAVDALSTRCFDDLARRLDLPTPSDGPPSEAETAASHGRLRHLLAFHGDGAWVVDGDDGLAAAALALRRERFWGLSLLVVDPAAQGRGLGRQVLQASMVTSADAARAMVLSSQDPRATRLYGGAGFAEHAGLRAVGTVRRAGLAHEAAVVRDGRDADRELAAEVDRGVRGGPHAAELDVLLDHAAGWWVVDEGACRGYAVLVQNRVALLAATDAEAARALLVRCLGAADPHRQVAVPALGAEAWAVELVRGAGLTVHPSGPTFTRGLGPPPWYLPNPAWL